MVSEKMRNYAHIIDGSVFEILDLGDEENIYTYFPPEMLWVEITGMSPLPDQKWTYDDGVFSPYVAPTPTPEQVLTAQSVKLQSLKQLAEAQKSALTSRISTLQDAIDNVGVEGMEEFAATDDEQIEFPKRKTQLTKWKNYAIALGRVTGQAGWPPEVVWPVQPTEGMDLMVSAAAPEIV